jgi:uncharacterized protein (DUF1501 family)
MMHPPTRRSLLRGAALALGAASLPHRIARATTGSDLKFVFVFNPGGWDPTRVFWPSFGSSVVSMEGLAEPATAGNLTYADHPDRPSVRAYLEQHHGRTTFLNGVMVRSIAHEICTMITMTGSSSGNAPDWPAQLADARRAEYTLPHLVLSGPSFPGDRAVSVARTGTNGQLAALLSGDAIAWSDQPTVAPTAPAEDLVDRLLARRYAARAAGASSPREADLTGALLAASENATALKDLQHAMDFTGGALLSDQARVAVDALALGLSRCVTLAYPGNWDTHATNDELQSPMWEDLFQALTFLQALLAGTPGHSAATLADETVVVVCSEMGRTPGLNSFLGKDHWPYTSVMITGPGIIGDRVVGAVDDNGYGLPIDPASGDVDASGDELLTVEHVGATLLALAGVDPGEEIATVPPIDGIIA